MKTEDLEKENAALKHALVKAKDLLLLIDTGPGDIIKYPKDPEVKELCERIGYGAVMDSAARQWRMKDHFGAVGAFTVGPCVVMVKEALIEIEKLMGEVEV